jgi:hypothetical protein
MSRQREAIKTVARVLEPLLERAGFEGRFPAYHRLGKRCVECLYVAVYVRGGASLYVGAVPPRTTLGRSAASDAKAFMSGSRVPGVQSQMVAGSLLIDTAAQVRALDRALPALFKRALATGRKLWAEYEDIQSARARDEAVVVAIGSGSAARLTEVLAGMSRKEAQEALDGAGIRRSDEPATIARCYGLAPALAPFRPPWMLGAILATGAALVLSRRPTAAGVREAQKVLVWVRRHIAKVEDLAGQIAIFADRIALKEPVAALTLFDLVIGTGELRAPTLGNALRTALAANNGLGVDRARHRRFLQSALRRAADDPAVRFNAACLCVELGDTAAASEHLGEALRRGARLDDAKKEPLLRGLLDDGRVASASSGRPTKPATRRGFVTHGRARRR